MCTWGELVNGSLTMVDLMKMHRSLNLKMYLEDLAHQAAENRR